MKTEEHWNRRNSSNSYKRSRFWVAESEQLQWQTSWWFRLRETCDILTSFTAKLWTINFLNRMENATNTRIMPSSISRSPPQDKHLDEKDFTRCTNINATCFHESLKTLSAQPALLETGEERLWSWVLPRRFGHHHDKTDMATTFLCTEDVFLGQRRHQAADCQIFH